MYLSDRNALSPSIAVPHAGREAQWVLRDD